VAKVSSQHGKCQVGNMLWMEGSSQPNKCQVGNMYSSCLDLFHSGRIGGKVDLTITRWE
jgi:hypothetical protein